MIKEIKTELQKEEWKVNGGKGKIAILLIVLLG